MNRRGFGRLACACAACAIPGWGAAQALAPRLAPGFRPAAESDERGLWELMSREEERLKGSRFVVRDAALNDYVRGIACRLAGDYCPDMRVYIVRAPYFNAFMAPNGMMQVWTGALMRLANEAQLASVVGHEIGHYLRRHSVDRFRDAKDKTAIAMVLSMGLTLAKVGSAGTLTNLLMTASVLSFGRDQEREADRIGLELLERGGYDPAQASLVWSQLIAERKAREASSPRDLVFASHPGEDEREETLREAARGMAGAGEEGRRHAARFREAMRGHRAEYFADELRLRHYGPSLALFTRMMEQDPGDGEAAFYAAEVLRLRAREGDHERALALYERACAGANAPPEAWRGIGLVRREREEMEAAGAAFRRYLELRPDAPDAAIVRSYL